MNCTCPKCRLIDFLNVNKGKRFTSKELEELVYPNIVDLGWNTISGLMRKLKLEGYPIIKVKQFNFHNRFLWGFN